MNKTALKKFATEARVELLEKVELQARKLGITAESIQKANVESSDAVFIDGKQLSDTERRQRNKLITRINEIGFDRVMEETAYTWFNRFIALRYMEVNDYLPTKVRVLSSNSGSAEPDMMKEALSLDLDLDKEKVYDLKMNNETDELFKYLIKMHCNDLNRYMPFMFETIEDYTEILFPEGLLGTDSFVRQMTDIEDIPEDDWQQVEIIGWLYQFYISEEKDEVFANLKKNIKITKDTLPAATQLFTPNWIVRYMVENSLGRIWLESNPESSLKNEWKYYLDEAEQEEGVIKQLEEIRYNNVNPEEITFLDPCCGSGHILVYAFDMFYDLYLEKGYIKSEIPKLILEKNLHGLDVDDRAVQLASFAVMMKARKKSRRVFNQNIQLNICAVEESNWLTNEMIVMVSEEQNQIQDILYSIQKVFTDAKEYGSLLNMKSIKYDRLEEYLQEYEKKQTDLVEMIDKQILLEKLPPLLRQSKIISKKYDVVCTNPPYMGNGNMGDYLKKFIQKKYPNSKADLCGAFIELGLSKTKKNGYCSMVTMHSWFFLNSFEALRREIINNVTISSILHLGMEAFDGIIGKVVQTAAFILKNAHVGEHKPIGIRLVDFYDGRKYEKEHQFFNLENRYCLVRQNDFNKIPGTPIAYWATEKISNIFNDNIKLGEIAEPRQGMSTSDNKRFLRLWYEVDRTNIEFGMKSREEAKKSPRKWFPYNKGGDFRKWYGNNDYIVNWKNDGEEVKQCVIDKYPYLNGNSDFVVKNQQFYFKEGITWTKVSSSNFSVRYSDYGFIFSDAGMKVFIDEDLIPYLCSFLNSKLVNRFLSVISETLNYEQGNIKRLPFVVTKDKYILSEVNKYFKENIEISKYDWDSWEISWDFKKHPWLDSKRDQTKIQEAFTIYRQKTEDNFEKVKNNEQEINRIFIEIYGLQEELSPEVPDKDITVRKAELQQDIRSFISYVIGCSFGRYSLDEEGLIYAGGDFEPARYQVFPADEDNILPILPGSYFEDDIVTRFIDFVRITFSEETLEENLGFVADAIGRRKNETARETLRRYFLNDFYKDHVRTYKKNSQIYWLFTSGKEKAFNCLIYMHRYDKTTLSRIRTDYLHEVQTRLDAEKNDLLEIINGDSTAREINSAKRELKSLDRKIDELKAYDELLHHMADMQIEIDLDDGVKVNYEKFEGLMAKI